MSEYEGKWPKCLNPFWANREVGGHYLCKYLGGNDVCFSSPDEGCPENKARSKEHCDCGNNDPEWGKRRWPELDNQFIEIKLPGTIKVGGFDYSIEVSAQHDTELKDANLLGQCSHGLGRIRILSGGTPQSFK